MPDAREDYTFYYYLWHLIALGVLKASPPMTGGAGGGSGQEHLCPEIEKAIWDHPSLVNGRQGVTVALIDMGVAPFHPNLSARDGSTSQIDWLRALDLASHRYGAKYVMAPASHVESRRRHLNNINVGLVGTNASEAAILAELQNGLGVERIVTAYNRHYATHGTACAGLVCGTTDNADQFGEEGNILVYYGVDPFSQVVPITTSISPDPYQLIAAFLYAHSLNVDVILLPRDFGDPERTPGFAALDADEKTRLDEGPVAVAWRLLERIVLEISQQLPIVCAAGNDGRSSLIYPASLSGQGNNGIISVGSVSYAGYRSGYSNHSPDLTVVAPSDDGEVYNRHQIRVDRKAVDFSEFWIDGVHQPPIGEISYSPERLITLDVPGPRGYADGSRQGPVASRAEAVDDPGSLYTEFGGTSGAAALVAGVCALMQRQSTAGRLPGPAVKASLTAAVNLDVSDWYWLEEAGTLQADAINSSSAPADSDLFGQGGLVNAAALLGIDWNDIDG